MYTDYQQIVLKTEPIDNVTLIRVVYISKATLLSRVNFANTLSSIEARAVAHNKLHGLSGVLCYGNGYFLQCLEGEKQNILPVLARIFVDKRHSRINIIDLHPIGVRTFTDWGMRSLLLEDWCWKELHQDYVSSLSYYMPFLPHTWSKKRINNFLSVINRTDVPFLSSKNERTKLSDRLSLSYDYLFVYSLFILCLFLLGYLYLLKVVLR